MNRSAEDYIKTIYTLKMKHGCVHSVDVAHELGFSKASVSVAMANLREKNIIEMKKNGEIEFTENGNKLAAVIYERHSILSGFLQKVAGVDEKTASADACRIEHFISDSTYSGIKKFVRNAGEYVYKEENEA